MYFVQNNIQTTDIQKLYLARLFESNKNNNNKNYSYVIKNFKKQTIFSSFQTIKFLVFIYKVKNILFKIGNTRGVHREYV